MRTRLELEVVLCRQFGKNVDTLSPVGHDAQAKFGRPDDSDVNPPSQLITVIRFFLIMLGLLATGCDDWPPVKMYAPVGVPDDEQQIDPWIEGLLSSDVNHAKQLVDTRLQSRSAAMSLVVKRMAGYVPCQVEFAKGVGHIRCVRRYTNKDTGRIEYEAIYLAQPLDEATLKARVDYFDHSVRPLMSEFLSRFAGSGEETQGSAGNFTFNSCPSAEDFGYRNENSLGEWKNARLFYHALNGDGVFIKPCGATAWRVLETDETIPIAATFEEFIQAYADFRSCHEVFDSWAYWDFKAHKPK